MFVTRGSVVTAYPLLGDSGLLLRAVRGQACPGDAIPPLGMPSLLPSHQDAIPPSLVARGLPEDSQVLQVSAWTRAQSGLILPISCRAGGLQPLPGTGRDHKGPSLASGTSGDP